MVFSRSNNLKLVLVVGAPRSGTTIVGDILSKANRAKELYEPMSLNVGITSVDNWFEIPGANGISSALAFKNIEDISQLKCNLKKASHPVGPLWEQLIKKFITGSRTKYSYRLCCFDPFLKTIIWKDPLAFFFLKIAAKEHGIPVVVCIRHPSAVAASLKRLKWLYDVKDLEFRMREAGLVSSDDLDYPEEARLSYAKAGAILWHLMYSQLMEWRKQNIPFFLVDNEDLLNDPVFTLERVCDFSGLVYNEKMKKFITKRFFREKSDRGIPRDGKVHEWNRNLTRINSYWDEILTNEEVDFSDRLNANLWEKVSSVKNS